MKLKSQIYFSLFICVTVMNSCHFEGNHNRNVFSYKLTEEEMALLQEGDIILRQGYGFVSNMIVKTLDEAIPLSHVGILVRDLGGDFFVVHSVSQRISDFDGMQRQSLQSFVRDSKPGSIVVVRYNALSDAPENAKVMQSRTLHYLDLKMPFDYSFSYEDTTRIFCSELVYRVIKDVFDDPIFTDYDASHSSGFTNGMLEALKFQNFFDEARFHNIINHHIPKPQ